MSQRVKVMQYGEAVGTVPADFDPLAIRSTDPRYTPSERDFRRDGDCWIADEWLGPGDLNAIPGFIAEPQSVRSKIAQALFEQMEIDVPGGSPVRLSPMEGMKAADIVLSVLRSD